MAEQSQNIEEIQEQNQDEVIQQPEALEQLEVLEQPEGVEQPESVDKSEVEEDVPLPSTSRGCVCHKLDWARSEKEVDPAVEKNHLAQINLKSCIQIIVDVKRSYNQLIDLVDYKLGTAESDGENYTGTITRARVFFKISDKTIEEDYIIKEDRTTGPVTGEGFFKSEIMMYRWILPKMWRLLWETRRGNEDIESQKLWCDYIGNKPFHSLILTDLCAEGFRLADRRSGLDDMHSLLVVKHLAKFHAMSKALLEQDALSKEDFEPHYTCVAKARTFILKFYEGGLRQLIIAMRQWPRDLQWLSTRVALQVVRVLKHLRDIHESPYDESFQVLNHGDLWTCNMMFKYDKNERPTDIRFLDYQVCHLHSFAWDLTHFLYSSIKFSKRILIYRDLIEEYHRSLIFYMNKFNCVSRRPTLSNVFSEMDRLAYYAFVVVSINYPLATTQKKKAFSLSKLLHSSENDPSQLPFYDGIFTTEDVILNLGLDLTILSLKGII